MTAHEAEREAYRDYLDHRDEIESDAAPDPSEYTTLTCACPNESDRDWVDDGDGLACSRCGEFVEPA